MNGYLIVLALYLVSCIHLTVMVVMDDTITQKQKIFRLCLIWLVPIIGINVMGIRYARLDRRS